VREITESALDLEMNMMLQEASLDVQEQIAKSLLVKLALPACLSFLLLRDIILDSRRP
jgi:hypothetical protein